MSGFNGEVWQELAQMRMEINGLKATVRRLDAADLRAYLWRQRVHEIGKCDACGEPHEVALVTRGPVTIGGNGLRALCESCFIRGRERQAVTA
jgi:hypothetical protein